MRKLSIGLVRVSLLLMVGSGSVCLGGPTMAGAMGIQSDSKVVGGSEVTIFVQEHKSVSIVLVSVVAPSVRYDEVTVAAFGQDGKPLPIAPQMEKTAYYMVSNPSMKGQSKGVYEVQIPRGAKLAKVKVARKGESAEFDVVLPAR